VIGEDVRGEPLDRLLAGAGHSLRTPLNSVLGFTKVLLTPETFMDQVEAFLDTEDRRGAPSARPAGSGQRTLISGP
jgi:signal transduction histidine kinase